ncbi:MAG: hypothetical protein KF764_02970 [Labilithrix sp.]|nr:hypothetical protein [Labilithrix sp.]
MSEKLYTQAEVDALVSKARTISQESTLTLTIEDGVSEPSERITAALRAQREEMERLIAAKRELLGLDEKSTD